MFEFFFLNDGPSQLEGIEGEKQPKAAAEGEEPAASPMDADEQPPAAQEPTDQPMEHWPPV